MKATRLLAFVMMMCLSCCLSAFGQLVSEEQAALRQRFESEYEAWKKDCDRLRFSSLGSDRLESEHFKNIVAMGPAALPYLVEKRLQDPDFTWAGWIRTYIARVSTSPSVSPWAKESITTWWEGGKRRAIERFDMLNNERKNLRSQGRLSETAAVQRSIRGLGIAALPRIMDELKAGDPNLLEVIQQITEDAADTSGKTTEERINSCLMWWAKNKERWLIPFPNMQPVANAGADQSVSPNVLVQLDGSASSDPDKDRLSYSWTQAGGPPVALSKAETARPNFTAPQVGEPTILIFQLVVDDGSPKKEVHPSSQSGQSKPALVRITVNPNN